MPPTGGEIFPCAASLSHRYASELPYIPCYALREALDLQNSSNPGEKANDLCVAARQKHQGMSWSRNGSVALVLCLTLFGHRSLNLTGRVWTAGIWSLGKPVLDQHFCPR